MRKQLTELSDRKRQQISLRLHKNIIFKTAGEKILEEEKSLLSEAIRAVKYPYSVKNLLVFVNRQIAEQMRSFSSPLFSEWGAIAVEFYQNSSDKRYVDSETGIVNTGVLGFKNGIPAAAARSHCHPLTYLQGVWDLSLANWNIPPNLPFNQPIGSLHTWISNGYVVTSPVPSIFNPANLNLFSPVHIAAIIGDIVLMQELINQGHSLDNRINPWKKSPLELAISAGQESMVEFLLKESGQKLLPESTILTIIEHGNLGLMEKCLTNPLSITDQILDLAKKRSEDLYRYLKDFRIKRINHQLSEKPTLEVFKSLLEYPQIPIQLLVDFMVVFPEMLSSVDGNSNADTHVHALIRTRDRKKVQAIMEAIFEAGFNRVRFDIEQKNAQGKTILDLALEQGNNELTAAILLYTNPVLNDTQKSQIIAAKIDLPGIHQKKESRMLDISQKQHHSFEAQSAVLRKHDKTLEKQEARLDIHNQVLQDTLVEVRLLKEQNALMLQQMEMQAQIIQAQSQQINRQQQILEYFSGILGGSNRQTAGIPSASSLHEGFRFFLVEPQVNSDQAEGKKPGLSGNNLD